MLVKGCTYHRNLCQPGMLLGCFPRLWRQSTLCNTIAVSCLTSFRWPAGPHTSICLHVLSIGILLSGLFHTVLRNLGIMLLLAEAGHEKVRAESLKPCVLFFVVHQFCQVTSFPLLNLNMSLNMRNN